MKRTRRRQEAVVTISAHYATGQGRRVERWLRSNAGFVRGNRLFFEELFIHLSLVLGFPTMIDGLEKLSKESPALKRPRRKQNSRKGSSLLRNVYGDQTNKLLINLRFFHPELPSWVLNDVYGRVFARRGMTLSERELSNVVVLSFQNLEKQLRSHVRGAQRAGLSLVDLRRALKTAMQKTGRRRLRSLDLLDPVVSQKKKT